MIIDAHTHIYPEKIAARIAEDMKKRGIEFHGSITPAGLLSSMEATGIDISLTFCLAERPETVTAANDFLLATCDQKKLFGLGTIHPDYQDVKGEVKRLREGGLRGIKFSSLFQDFYPDEERMFRIYQEMGEDMVVYLHAGPPQATPDRIARVLDAFPRMKVVAAHFGGQHMLEEARKYLVGRDLYLDVAWPPDLGEVNSDLVVEIIREHGPKRVLFASDYPAARQDVALKALLNLPLSPEAREQILWRNANELFRLGLQA